MRDISSFRRYFFSVGILLISNVAFYYFFKWVIKSLDPFGEYKGRIKEKSNKIILRLRKEYGLLDKKLDLNEYERVIMTEVVLNKDINITFDSKWYLFIHKLINRI